MGEPRRCVDKEDAPDLNFHERTRLLTLWRRIWYVEARIKTPTDTGSVSWDKKEAHALRWVLKEASLPSPRNQNYYTGQVSSPGSSDSEVADTKEGVVAHRTPGL